jgi:hypothetical protein
MKICSCERGNKNFPFRKRREISSATARALNQSSQAALMVFTRKETPLKYPDSVGCKTQEWGSTVLADRMMIF